MRENETLRATQQLITILRLYIAVNNYSAVNDYPRNRPFS